MMDLTAAKAAREDLARQLYQVSIGERTLAQVLRLHALDVPALVTLAAGLAAENDLENAETAAELATQADVQSFDAWMTLGAVRARRSDEHNALVAYARAATLQPQNPRVWCDVGELRLILLDYAGAAQALQLAIRADPEAETPAGARAQYLVARTYAELSDGNG